MGLTQHMWWCSPRARCTVGDRVDGRFVRRARDPFARAQRLVEEWLRRVDVARASELIDELTEADPPNGKVDERPKLVTGSIGLSHGEGAR